MASKELLEHIKNAPSFMGGDSRYTNCSNSVLLYIEDIVQIRKDLEVLKIIKTKLVFPLALMSLPYELYNNSVMKEQQLTQEEYDKIKEWLKNE